MIQRRNATRQRAVRTYQAIRVGGPRVVAIALAHRTRFAHIPHVFCFGCAVELSRTEREYVPIAS